jgi:DNA transformation protein
MDADRLAELFGGLGPIRTRQMFGGLGVYVGDAMFALVANDTLFMKTDTPLAADYAAAGSSPFTYTGKGRPVTMSFWRLPDDAHDDPDLALDWGRRSLAAAQEAAARRRG